MTIELLFTLWQLGEILPEKIPNLATDLLKVGNESKSMIELAGLVQPSRNEVDIAINKAILELKGDDLNREKFPYFIAKAIVEKEITPDKGAYLIGLLSSELKSSGLEKFENLYMESEQFEKDQLAAVENREYPLNMINQFKNDVLSDIYKLANEYLLLQK